MCFYGWLDEGSDEVQVCVVSILVRECAVVAVYLFHGAWDNLGQKTAITVGSRIPPSHPGIAEVHHGARSPRCHTLGKQLHPLYYHQKGVGP